MTDPIRILFASDIHFAAPSLNQEEMAKAFADTIFPLIPETDIFFINGDFFDREVFFDSVIFDPIYDAILNLFALCERHQTKLRVLQGTWTHDRGQCKRFEVIYRNHGCTFDFKFHEAIALEEIAFANRNLKVFYVPDDLPFKQSSDIADVVVSKMQEMGWDSVDYACMHGFFDFTFPKNVSQENRIVFNKEQFPFVKKIINVGHVHQFRIDENAISNGSFDRSCHGDEEPKGCVSVIDYPDRYVATFVPNKDAAIFDTLKIEEGDETDDIVSKITKHLDSLTTTRQIHLRFITATTEQYSAVKSWMMEYHPLIKTVRKAVSDRDDGHLMIPSSSLVVEVEARVAPTRKTIGMFIKNRLQSDDPLTIDRIEFHLEAPGS